MAVAIGRCDAYVMGSGYGSHYLSDKKRLIGFYFHCSQIFMDRHVCSVDCWLYELQCHISVIDNTIWRNLIEKYTDNENSYFVYACSTACSSAAVVVMYITDTP